MFDTVPGCYVVSCMVIGTALGMSLGNAILPREDAVQQQIKCNQHCPYGFLTDMEGFYTCTCYEPCSNVFCLSGTKCVVEVDNNCTGQRCMVAVCKGSEDEPMVTVEKKLSPWAQQFPDVQGDGPWWGVGTNDDLCSQSLPQHAVTCRRRRRRWYYNAMTGKCVRFMGCDTHGNNFSRKRYCKTKCRNKRIEFRLKHRKSSRKDSPR